MASQRVRKWRVDVDDGRPDVRGGLVTVAGHLEPLRAEATELFVLDVLQSVSPRLEKAPGSPVELSVMDPELLQLRFPRLHALEPFSARPCVARSRIARIRRKAR